MRSGVFRIIWRQRLWIAVALWLTAAALHWHFRVPLLHADVLLQSSGWEFAGFTTDGNLVARKCLTDGKPRPYMGMGPVRVRDMDSKAWISPPIGDESSSVELGSEESGIALVRRERTLSVVQLKDARELFQLADLDPFSVRVLSDDGKFLAVKDDSSLRVYRVADGAEVWSTSDLERLFSMSFVGLDLLSFTCRRSGHMHVESRNTRTWELDDRFPENQRFFKAVSVDNRFALSEENTSGISHWTLFDYATGNRLWDVPECAVPPTFYGTGSEVIGITSTADGSLQVERWNSADGGPLSRTALSQTDPGRLGLSPNGEYLVGQHQSSGASLPYWLQEWLNRLGVDWYGVLKPDRTYLTITDLASGSRRGSCLPAATFLGTSDFVRLNEQSPNLRLLSVGRSALVTRDDAGNALIHRLPPPKNWKWLVGWGLGPVLVMVAFRTVIATRRRNRPNAGSVAAAPTIVEDSGLAPRLQIES